MVFWRCVLWAVITLLTIAVLSFAEAVSAEAYYEQQESDPAFEVFSLCIERMQLDIDLGLSPGMSSEKALQICTRKTESVLQELERQGVDVGPGRINVVPF